MSDDPLRPVQSDQPLTATSALREWAAREVFGKDLAAKDAQVRTRFADPVAQGLENALDRFETALRAFAWPSGSRTWFTARAATTTAQTVGALSAVPQEDGTAAPLVKAFSGGFRTGDRTSLTPGSYAFDVTLGDATETFSVDVGDSDTWGAVLGKVADVVNAGGLAVRADVALQNAPFTVVPQASGTGSVLTLSVNPARADQTPALADTSGHLLESLRLTAARNPQGAATETEYQVQGLQRALPTLFTATPVDPNAATTLALGRHDLAYAVGDTDQPQSYISKVFDPTAATTLAAGTYTFTSTTGGETRRHTVTIGSGWTWNDVLERVAGEVNGQNTRVSQAESAPSGPATTYAQAGVSAAVDSWPIASSSQQGVYTDGKSLTVTDADGRDFSLADASGGLLSTLGLTTRLTGTPVSFTVEAGDTWQDTSTSLAAALNGAQPYFTTTAARTVIPSAAVPGMDLHHLGLTLALVQENQRIGQRVSLSDGATGVLAATGLASRERPGQDGAVSVNGATQVSENNIFSLDDGRLLLRLNEPFGESLPLAVQDAVQAVEDGLSRVTNAYNDLARYLYANRDVLRDDLRRTLDAPLNAQAGNLSWLGMKPTGRQGLIWVNGQTFWRSAYTDPDRAGLTLASAPDGLIPAWEQAVNAIRAQGPSGWLKPTTAFENQLPKLTSEFELEQKNRLLKLIG